MTNICYVWFSHFGVILLDTCIECFAANQDKEKWAFRIQILKYPHTKTVTIFFSFLPFTNKNAVNERGKNWIPFGPRSVEIIIEFAVNYRRVKQLEFEKKIIEKAGQFFIWVYELPQPINHNFSIWMKRTLWLWSRMLV